MKERPTNGQVIIVFTEHPIPVSYTHLDVYKRQAQKREVNVALSNTFGFGGHNACVIFKKYAE